MERQEINEFVCVNRLLPETPFVMEMSLFWLVFIVFDLMGNGCLRIVKQILHIQCTIYILKFD